MACGKRYEEARGATDRFPAGAGLVADRGPERRDTVITLRKNRILPAGRLSSFKTTTKRVSRKERATPCAKFNDKEEMIQQVKTELHYWYGEGYGSERRKKPA